LAWLQELAPAGTAEGAALYHGSARDPIWEYVLSDEAAVATLMLTDAPLVLVGHSHVALQIALRGMELEGGLAPGGTALGLGEARWLLNPGSVGQPRDGDPDAAYLVLDLDARTATFRRVPYDVQATQEAMREAGLPELLALRLQVGQ
jgi:diadenosine tetraphosphatase ApaH/serine/threonine PP2A family protein phosphatase